MKNPPVRRTVAARPDIIDKPVIEEPKFSLLDYVVPVLVLCALGSVAFAAWSFFSSRNTAHKSAATGELVFATRDEDPESYRMIGEEYQDTGAGHWAAAAQADLYLSQGLEALFVDRDEAKSLIESAATTYRQVIDRSQSELLRSRAMFGLAQSEEASGNLDDAISQYRKVANLTGASEALVKESNSRADTLERDETKDFYKWFISQNPSTVGSKATPPASLDKTPGDPNIEFPDSPNKKQTTEVAPATEGNAETPASTGK